MHQSKIYSYLLREKIEPFAEPYWHQGVLSDEAHNVIPGTNPSCLGESLVLWCTYSSPCHPINLSSALFKSNCTLSNRSFLPDARPSWLVHLWFICLKNGWCSYPFNYCPFTPHKHEIDAFFINIRSKNNRKCFLCDTIWRPLLRTGPSKWRTSPGVTYTPVLGRE